MSVQAIFRNGVFEPLGQVDLPDETRVDLEVVARHTPAQPTDAPLHDSAGKLLSLGLFGPPSGDFKELGPEWRDYVG